MDAGSSHSLAVRQDGSAWAWGQGSNGRLGTGNENQQTVPVVLASSAQFGNVTSVAAGTNHNLALDASRQVWTWGDNSGGQLGQGVTGSQYDQYHPVKVLGPGGVSVLSNTVAIATGYKTSYAVQGDGTLWAWGENTDGQLGDGSTSLRNTPVQVMVSSTVPLTQVVSVVGGGNFAVALQEDGTVWA